MLFGVYCLDLVGWFGLLLACLLACLFVCLFGWLVGWLVGLVRLVSFGWLPGFKSPLLWASFEQGPKPPCSCFVIWGLFPHSFQPSFFSKADRRCPPGFWRFSRKKDSWKEWGRSARKQKVRAHTVGVSCGRKDNCTKCQRATLLAKFLQNGFSADFHLWKCVLMSSCVEQTCLLKCCARMFFKPCVFMIFRCGQESRTLVCINSHETDPSEHDVLERLPTHLACQTSLGGFLLPTPTHFAQVGSAHFCGHGVQACRGFPRGFSAVVS